MAKYDEIVNLQVVHNLKEAHAYLEKLRGEINLTTKNVEDLGKKLRGEINLTNGKAKGLGKAELEKLRGEINSTNGKVEDLGKKLRGEINLTNGKVEDLGKKLRGEINSTTEKVEDLGKKTSESPKTTFFSKIKSSADMAGSAIGRVVRWMGALASGAAVYALYKTAIATDQFRSALYSVYGQMGKVSETEKFLRLETRRLGLSFIETAKSFSQVEAALKGTSIKDQAREIFLGVSEAGAALKLSVDQQQGAFRAITQIISKGNVQAEELRGQLGERLPGAFQIAARAVGVTTSELDKMLELGRLSAEDFIPKFARQLRKEYSGSLALAADSTQSWVNRLKNVSNELQDAFLMSGAKKVFDDLLRLLVELGSSQSVLNFFQDLGKNISRVSDDTKKLINYLKETKEILYIMATVTLPLLALALKSFALSNPITATLLAITSLSALFITQYDVIVGETKRFFGKFIVYWDHIGKYFPMKVKDILNEVIEATKTGMSTLKSLFTLDFDGIAKSYDKFKKIINGGIIKNITPDKETLAAELQKRLDEVDASIKYPDKKTVESSVVSKQETIATANIDPKPILDFYKKIPEVAKAASIEELEENRRKVNELVQIYKDGSARLTSEQMKVVDNSGVILKAIDENLAVLNPSRFVKAFQIMDEGLTKYYDKFQSIMSSIGDIMKNYYDGQLLSINANYERQKALLEQQTQAEIDHSALKEEQDNVEFERRFWIKKVEYENMTAQSKKGLEQRKSKTDQEGW